MGTADPALHQDALVTPSVTLQGHAQDITSLAWSFDGNLILTGAGGFDLGHLPLPGEARLWDAQTRRPILSLKTGKDTVLRVAISPDGKHIAASGRDYGVGKVMLWDAATGRALYTFGSFGSPVWHLAFSSDSGRIYASDNAPSDYTYAASAFSVATGKEVLRYEKSADGNQTVTGADGETLNAGDALQ